MLRFPLGAPLHAPTETVFTKQDTQETIVSDDKSAALDPAAKSESQNHPRTVLAKKVTGPSCSKSGLCNVTHFVGEHQRGIPNSPQSCAPRVARARRPLGPQPRVWDPWSCHQIIVSIDILAIITILLQLL